MRTHLDFLGLASSYAERIHEDWDVIALLHHRELEDCARECGMDAADSKTFVDYVVLLAGPLQQAEVLIDASDTADTSDTAQEDTLDEGDADADMPLRLGLACITKQPANMATWLAHHADSIGVEHFFMRVEETPELAELFSKPRWINSVHATFALGPTEADSGSELCARMDRNTMRAIDHGRELGCTHILLCDDDELLYAPSGRAALHGAIRQVTTEFTTLDGPEEGLRPAPNPRPTLALSPTLDPTLALPTGSRQVPRGAITKLYTHAHTHTHTHAQSYAHRQIPRGANEIHVRVLEALYPASMLAYQSPVSDPTTLSSPPLPLPRRSLAQALFSL